MATTSMWGIEHSQTETGNIIRAELGRFGQGRSPRVEPGDSVVLFAYVAAELGFWGEGEVINIQTQQMQSPETLGKMTVEEVEATRRSEYYEYFAEIKVTGAFDEKRDLTDLCYSLERVYRFDRPYIHFSRRYVRLSSADVETIRGNEMYWERTAFGILAGALAREDRIAIVPELLAGGNKLTYRTAVERLHNYVWSHYVALATLVVETHDLVEQGRADGSPVQSVVFVAAEQTRPVALGDFAEICRPVAATEKQPDEPDPFLALLENTTPSRLLRVFPVTLQDLLRLLQVHR